MKLLLVRTRALVGPGTSTSTAGELKEKLRVLERDFLSRIEGDRCDDDETKEDEDCID